MLSPDDLKELEAKGIAPEQIEAQLERFRTGFPYLKILDAARPGRVSPCSLRKRRRLPAVVGNSIFPMVAT